MALVLSHFVVVSKEMKAMTTFDAQQPKMKGKTTNTRKAQQA
jgi:hypothetical protein